LSLNTNQEEFKWLTRGRGPQELASGVNNVLICLTQA
jgi:hypothetical protein